MKKVLLTSIIYLTMTFAMNAQNISGHYSLQSKEMVNGKEYFNAIAKDLNVTQTNDSVKIIRVIPSLEAQPTISVETLPINGKQVVIFTISKRKKTSSVIFDKKNNKVIIVTTISYPEKYEEVEFKNTEVWSVLNDISMVITKTSDATVTDDWTIKAVFKKINN